MANPATRHVLDVRDVVFLLESQTELELIRRRRIRHVEYLVARPQEPFRRAMTVEAPSHEQGAGLKHEGHPVDLAVTRHAADTLLHMNLVVEINEIWQVVYPNPRERRIVSEAGSDCFE